MRIVNDFRFAVVFLVGCLCCWLPSGHAQSHRSFSVQKTAVTEKINGEVEWPGGDLGRWQGPVLIFISAAGPSDRDGWLVRALETVWADRKPLSQLADAMLREGFAVVRFDNPGVRQPPRQCREAINKLGMTQDTILRRCIETEVLRRATVENYVRSIESVVVHLKKMMPAAKKKIVLFGFSEGGVHAASIVQRGHVKVNAVISIGSPVESMASVTHWQAVERMLETLSEFDINGDGIVSNEEIEQGYRTGIGNFMNVGGWLSPSGQWDDRNKGLLLARVNTFYQAALYSVPADGTAPGKLQWVEEPNGVLIPDITDSIWNLHFFGRMVPGEVLRDHAIPSLFIWGDKDRQVGVERQMQLLRELCSKGGSIQYARFPDRHHLLSARKDLDWLETEFMPTVAKRARDFIDSNLP